MLQKKDLEVSFEFIFLNKVLQFYIFFLYQNLYSKYQTVWKSKFSLTSVPVSLICTLYSMLRASVKSRQGPRLIQYVLYALLKVLPGPSTRASGVPHFVMRPLRNTYHTYYNIIRVNVHYIYINACTSALYNI